MPAFIGSSPSFDGISQTCQSIDDGVKIRAYRQVEMDEIVCRVYDNGQLFSRKDRSKSVDELRTSDTSRQKFLEHTGIESWNHNDTDWEDRGIEVVAQVIAWGLLETPITNTERFTEQLRQFELLTGIATPRLTGTA